MIRSLASLFFVALFVSTAWCQALPESVTVLPVFVVPSGQRQPSKSESRLLMRHLEWAQRRYREMLGGRSTFQFENEPLIMKSKRTLKQYESEGNAANLVVGELLDRLKVDRFSCQHIFLTVFVSRDSNFPRGGGRPINGGYNSGGGIVVLSYQALKSKNFQSTLQHELGHAFGLPHVTAYHYDMKRNGSIMSYNPAHHTNKFSASKTPGTLIPEDIRGLALNDRVFKNLTFETRQDVPSGYAIHGVGHLPAMDLPNHPLIQVETEDGEDFKTSVSNIVHSRILPSIDRGKVEFHKGTMWQSGKQLDGIVQVTLTFPDTVSLDRMDVCSQHSGKYHRAEGVSISTVADNDDTTVELADVAIEEADASIKFQRSTSKKWMLEFRTGDSKVLVLRGVRFFDGGNEKFAPLVPVEWER